MLVVGTMRFIADNGSIFSLICYSSGNIMLGGIIDGISIACDISLAFNINYGSKEDKQKAIASLVTSSVANILASKATKGMNLLGQKQFEEKLIQGLGVLFGAEFDLFIDNIIDQME